MSRLPIKLFAGLFVAALLLSMVAGCAKTTADVSHEFPGYLPVLYRDSGTGCEYLGREGQGSSLTPRIAADGKSHMGCKDAKP